MTTRTNYLNLFLAALVLGCSSGGSVTGAEEPRENEIWESMLVAKGGRARLQSVHTFVFRSALRHLDWSANNVVGGVQYEFVVAFPGQLWGWQDYRPGVMGFATEALDLSRGTHWFSMDGGKAKQLPMRSEFEPFLRRRIEELQVLYLLETKFVKPRLLAATSLSKDDSVILAVQTQEHVKIEYVVDTRTWLPRSVRLTPKLDSGAGPQSEFVFDGEQEVSGLRMPRRVHGFGDVTFIIDPVIDPGLFTTPPDGVTSSGTWQKWLVRK